MLQNDIDLQELAQSPLILSILILTYQGRPAQDMLPAATATEERRTALFAAYVERMFRRRGYERRFQQQQAIRWLSWLGQRMVENSQSIFFFEQLQPSWLTKRQERVIYMLLSRLIAGCLLGIIVAGAIATNVSDLDGYAGMVLLSASIAWLGSMIGGAVGGMIEFRRYEMIPKTNIQPISSFRRTMGLVMREVLGIVVGVLIGLGVPIVALTIVDRLQQGGSFVWSLTQALRQLVFILIVAIYTALVLGPMFGMRAGTRTQAKDIQTIDAFQFSKRGALAGMLVGTLVGSGFALLNPDASSWIPQWLDYMLRYCTLGALIGGLTGKKIEVSYRPNQGILRSIQKATALGFSAIIIFGLLGATTGGLLRSLWRGTIIGLLLFMWYGGFDVAQHYTLRALLALKGYAPWNYAGFLDFAVERIFLQKIGPGYLFIHRFLLEYFATLGDVPDSLTSQWSYRNRL